MAKMLRLALYLFGGLLALLVLAGLLLPLIVDPNDYKDDITGLVQDKTGRSLKIEGDLGLSVFPWLALEIGPTQLGNAPGFGAEPFARVKAVQIRVKLLPLLGGKLEMDTLRLDGLQLNLSRNRHGQSNWDDLLPAAAPAPVEAPPKPGAATPPAAVAGLAIGGVRISDARLVWDDQLGGARYVVAPLSLRTSAIRPGQPVDVKFEAKAEAAEPALTARAELDARVQIDQALQRLRLDRAQLALRLTGESLPAQGLAAGLATQAVLDMQAQTLKVERLDLDALGMELSGRLTGSQVLADGRVLSGDFELREFAPRAVLRALGQALPPMADPGVLGKAGARFHLRASADDVAVSKLVARLDDSTLQGGLSVAHFQRPAIRFDAVLDRIDLDRYLPPPSPTHAQPPVTPSAAAAAGAGALPVDSLRRLDLAGALKVGSLKAGGLRSRDIDVKLLAKGGQIRVHPASAQLYGGSYRGDVRLDVRGRQPLVSVDEALSAVQVGPLLKDLTGVERLTGTANANARLSATGPTPEALIRTLNGRLSFAFTDGAVKGIDLPAMIRKARATLKGEPQPTDSGPNQTDFSELTGTASVTNGIVNNQDLEAKSPLLRVSGQGTLDLPAQRIDYLLKTKLVGSLEGQGGAELAELKGLVIPVRISGSFSQPRYALQLDEVLRKKAEARLREQLDKRKQKLEQKLERQLQDKLRGLFN